MDLLNSIATTVAEANSLLFQELELEPFFDQTEGIVNRNYGFTMPRQLTPEGQNIRQGFQQYTWTIDVLIEFIIAHDANIQQETALALLKVNNAIASLNELVRPLAGARSGNWNARNLSSTQSQEMREPHNWKITIVGEANMETYIYRDRCGRLVDYGNS